MNSEVTRPESQLAQTPERAQAQNTKELLANEAWQSPGVSKCDSRLLKGGCGADLTNQDSDRAWQRAESEERLGGKLPVPRLPDDNGAQKPNKLQKPQDGKEHHKEADGSIICGPIVAMPEQKLRPGKTLK